MRLMKQAEFDVMLEAKAKDLALIRLRNDMLRYAPDVAQRFSLFAAPPDIDDVEIPADALQGA